MTLPSIGPISLNELRSAYQSELLEKLDCFPNPKVIYWDKSLMSPLNSIVGHSILKEHGISKSFLLENNEASCSPPDSKSVVLILPSNIKSVDCAQSFILRDVHIYKKSPKEYHIIAIPSLSFACKNFLKDKGVLGKISSIYEFHATLLPVDADILSMEDPDCFANYSMFERQQSIYQFVQGLMRFQEIYGLFPTVRAKGSKSKEVARMLIRLRQEMEFAKSDNCPLSAIRSRTAMLIILDRSIDCLTPLLSQLTYEGLISQKWGIRYGVCRLPAELSGSNDQANRVILNSSDSVFAELRDQNFTAVGSILSRKSKEMATLVTETKAIKELPQLRRVAFRLPEIRSTRIALETHTTIAECLRKHVFSDDFMQSLSMEKDFLNGYETDKAHPFIEDCLLRGSPIEEVLRLMCIQCFCNGGLKQHLFDYYRREILQTYGFEYTFTLDNLDRIGLLYDTSTKGGHGASFRLALGTDSSRDAHLTTIRSTVTAVSNMFGTSLKKTLRLLVPPSTTQDTADLDQALSDVYSGYIPISVRMVQALSLGWVPKTVSSTAGQLTSAGPSHTSAFKTSVLLAAKGLVSDILPEDHSQNSPSLSSSSPIPTLQPSQSMALSNGANFVGTWTPGDLLEEKQVCDPVNRLDELSEVTDSKSSSKSKVVVVAFIGGVTHAEVSALRHLAANCDDVEFLIATTGFLNPRNFVHSVCREIQSVRISS